MPRRTIRDFGYSLGFVLASAQRVNIATATAILASRVNSSVVLWMKSTCLPDPTNIPALYSERASTGNDIWKLEIVNGTKALRFTHRDDAGTLDSKTNASGISVVNGKWHMVTLTKAGTAINLYVDTVLDLSATLTGSDTMTNSIYPIVGGDQHDATCLYTGLIDEVSLWTRTLSISEIQDLYYNGDTVNHANLVGLYHFDEGSGTTTADATGTRVAATLVNTPTWSTDVFIKPRQAAL